MVAAGTETSSKTIIESRKGTGRGKNFSTFF
jgi:hypothetical protein